MKHYLLLLYFLCTIKSSSSTNRDTVSDQPIEDKCPKEYELIDYCSAEHASCNDLQKPSSTCSAQLERCISSRKVKDVGCKKYVERFLRNSVNSNSSFEDGSQIISRWNDNLQNVTDIMKGCGSVLKRNGNDFEQAVQSVQWLNNAFSNSTCTEAKLLFDHNLILSDQDVQHFVPFDRFRCGWSLGYIGKAHLRQVISLSCGSSTFEINHCCATHMNCHLLEKGDLEVCDQEFIDCQQRVTDTMFIWKTTCQKYNIESVEALPMMMKDSQLISKKKLQTKIDVSTERYKLSITFSEISEFKSTRITFFKLRADLNTPRPIFKYFNENILKHGWNKRIIIDSCGMMLENSLRYDGNGTIYRKLATCLNDIDNKTEEFENAVREFDKLVTKHLNEEVTMGRMDEMIEDKIRSFHLKLVLEYLFFTALAFLLGLVSPQFKAFLKNIICSICKKDETRQESVPLQELNPTR